MTIMIFEGLMSESEQDAQTVTQSDVDWYVAEVIAPVWDTLPATHGWLHATPEEQDKIIFPAFDLLGEPW